MSNLNRWNYEKFPEIFGGGKGFRVKDKISLENILKNYSVEDTTIIVCEIPKKDLPKQ